MYSTVVVELYSRDVKSVEYRDSSIELGRKKGRVEYRRQEYSTVESRKGHAQRWSQEPNDIVEDCTLYSTVL